MVNTQEKLKQYLKKIKEENPRVNAVLELRDEDELLGEAKRIDDKIIKGKAGKLAGKIIGVKANICVKGLHASCASKTLESYKASYDATVVKKIKDEDGLIIGMLNMDEFASGSSGETSAFGPTRNPADTELISGGSSSGPAVAVAGGFCDLTLGSDTGGSIRNPASYCGCVGMKPSYSVVSRYGLIDLAMSTDVIGPFGNSVADVKLLFDVIKSQDDCDAVSEFPPTHLRAPSARAEKNKIVVGVLDYSGLKVDERIKKLIDKRVDEVVQKNKWKIKKVKLNYLDLAIETYYPIVYVEAFSGTRKLDGRRFGKKIEDSCGPEFLRRILGGSEITKAEYGGRYYYKALKVKKMFEEEFAKLFKSVDCVVCPVVPKLPHKIGSQISVEEMYAYDAFTLPSSLAGNCAISVPAGKLSAIDPPTHLNKAPSAQIPVGVQIICDKFEDEKLLEIAKEFE